MDLYTRKEAAQRLHIGITKLQELISAGKISYFQERPGCKILFSAEDLDRYDESRRVNAAKPPIRNIYDTYRKRRVTA